MAKLPVVSSKPKLAVQYILDTEKLKTVQGLRGLLGRTKKAVRSLGFELTEFEPEIDADAIAANARSCTGPYAGFLGVTFTGTSARQTAAIGAFRGPVAVWFFPETEWWSMASAASGLGYLRDEADEDPAMSVAAVWGDPEDPAALERLERFARAAHTVFAMRREKIGLIGGSYYEVMPASNWHPDTLTSRLGPSYTEIDMSLLVRELDNVSGAEITGLVRRLTNAAMKLPDDEASLDVVKQSARVALAVEHLQERFALTGVAMNCYGGPDPEGYTGVLGCCGASGCLKGHALGSVVIGCESDVVQTAQQMMFRHLLGAVPCMADPWMVDKGVLLAGTCGGPAGLAPGPEAVAIEAGTLMSLYKVGVLGVCFPKIGKADAIVARLKGRWLDSMVVSTGEFLGSDTKTIPGRLCLKVKLDDPEAFLARGTVGNHYTFLPTEDLARDMGRLEMLCELMDIEIEYC